MSLTCKNFRRKEWTKLKLSRASRVKRILRGCTLFCFYLTFVVPYSCNWHCFENFSIFLFLANTILNVKESTYCHVELRYINDVKWWIPGEPEVPEGCWCFIPLTCQNTRLIFVFDGKNSRNPSTSSLSWYMCDLLACTLFDRKLRASYAPKHWKMHFHWKFSYCKKYDFLVW